MAEEVSRGEPALAEITRALSPGSSLWSRIGPATLGIACIALIVKCLGFGEKLVVAYFFGSSRAVDAYFVAVSVPTLFFLLVRELIEAPFLPLFVQALRQQCQARGWRLFTAVASGILVLGGCFSVFVASGSDWLAAHLAPGFESSARDTIAQLLRTLSPAALFLALSALTYITLNGYQRFAWPALGDVAWKLGPILACWLWVGRIEIEVLVVGYLLGSVARLAVHLAGLASKLPLLGWPRRSERGDLVQFGVLLLPLVFGSVLAQVGEVADNYFSSLLGEGGVAARTYAKKLRDLPLEIVPATLSIVLLPHFALLYAAGETERLRSLLASAVKWLAVCFALVGVLLFALAEPVVSLALERGAFGAEARVVTAQVLRLYALGMVTFAVEGPLVNFFFAVKDTRTPILAGVLHAVLNVVLCALLIRPLDVAGVALSLTLSKTAKVVVLAFLLHRGKHALPFGAIVRFGLVLAAAAGAAFLGVELYLESHGLALGEATALAKALHLAAASLLGAFLFFCAFLPFGTRERTSLREALRRMRRRNGSA